MKVSTKRYFLLFLPPSIPLLFPKVIEETKYSGKKSIEHENITTLKIMFGSPTLLIEREQLAFPFSSLVADCGGTLGLFIGFNFVMIWDFFMFLLKLGWSKMKQ